jgi:hypothetical protein
VFYQWADIVRKTKTKSGKDKNQNNVKQRIRLLTIIITATTINLRFVKIERLDWWVESSPDTRGVGGKQHHEKKN